MSVAILFGLSCGLAYLVATLWLRLRRMRALCRRVAEHLGSECHTGIQDIDTHRELLAECERSGWGQGGKER